jgi:hypothetical protein
MLRDTDDKSVQFWLQADLATEAAIRPHVEREIQHILFHGRWAAGRFLPGIVDIDVACCARASAAAFRNNPGHGILDRGFHYGLARLAFDRMHRPIMLDICDFHPSTVIMADGAICKGYRSEIQSANSALAGFCSSPSLPLSLRLWQKNL